MLALTSLPIPHITTPQQDLVETVNIVVTESVTNDIDKISTETNMELKAVETDVEVQIPVTLAPIIGVKRCRDVPPFPFTHVDDDRTTKDENERNELDRCFEEAWKLLNTPSNVIDAQAMQNMIQELGLVDKEMFLFCGASEIDILVKHLKVLPGRKLILLFQKCKSLLDIKK